MPIYLGTTEITLPKLGTTDLSKVYLGTTQLWPAVVGGTPTIAQFGQTSSWHVTTTPQNVTGLAWSSGNIIIAAGLGDDSGSSFILNAPTNANLTFTQEAAATGGSSETVAYLWKATAGSSQSGQTIAMTISGPSGNHRGLAVWVISGATSTANPTGNRAEGAISINPNANSIVVYAMGEYQTVAGNKVATTASGTVTERQDTIGSFYGAFVADWAGVSAGSQSFGIQSYTGMRISHVAIEVRA